MRHKRYIIKDNNKAKRDMKKFKYNWEIFVNNCTIHDRVKHPDSYDRDGIIKATFSQREKTVKSMLALMTMFIISATLLKL